ncbi:MAG: TGS domain-containing protein, partial [Bdellovibrionota bacterium]
EEFLDTVKTDLFESEIYVFTPNGDVREFPEGATPVDFAYAVHTQLGNQCVGARVNGKMVPLKHKLQNGDSVEIMTSKTQEPSKDWLKFVVTNKAKSRIRQYVKEEQRRRSLLLGKELVEKEFRKFGHAAVRFLKGEIFDKFIADGGLHSVDELYIRVGYGKLEPRHLVDKLVPPAESKAVDPKEKEKDRDNISALEKIVKNAQTKQRKSKSLISVDGMNDVLVHYAKCCSPIPGDPIVGFISRGRGITVHRSDCQKGFEQDQLRRVDVQWNMDTGVGGGDRTVKIKVFSQDGPGLLKMMSEAFAVKGINIQSAQIRTTRDKTAICVFEIMVKNSQQLNDAIFELQKIKGIMGVERLMG